MTKHAIGAEVAWQTSHTFYGATQIAFKKLGGEWTPPTILQHAPSVPPMLPVSPQASRPHLTQPQIPLPSIPAPLGASQIPQGWPGQRSNGSGRSYMAGVARWLSRARLEEQLNESEHPYSYVENNPLRWADPSGRIKPCGYGWYQQGFIYVPGVSYPPPTSSLPGYYAPACGVIPSHPPGMCFTLWMAQFTEQGISPVGACVRANAQCGAHINCASQAFLGCPSIPVPPLPWLPIPWANPSCSKQACKIASLASFGSRQALRLLVCSRIPNPYAEAACLVLAGKFTWVNAVQLMANWWACDSCPNP